MQKRSRLAMDTALLETSLQHQTDVLRAGVSGLGQPQFFMGPVTKSVWPGGGHDMLTQAYNPAQQRSVRCVLPKFYSSSGVQRLTSWPPPTDPQLERLGCYQTGKKCGPNAPGYWGTEYNCPNVPFVGQPSWYQGGGMGDAKSIFRTAFGFAVPLAVLTAIVVGGVSLAGLIWPERTVY